MTTPQPENIVRTPAQLLLEALEKRWKTYLAELKSCRAEFSNEAVHDMRVALRRLLSLIRLLNSISPRPRLQKLDLTLKNQIDEFDELRDTQVLLAEISETVHELPQLHKLQNFLERVERGLLRRLRKKIKKLDLKEVTRRIRKTHESIQDEMSEDVFPQILLTVDDAFLVTKQRRERIDPDRPATIHRMRIAFKTFRYMVEIIHPLLEDFPEANLKLMNDYQSLMGEIQDLEIFTQTLADFAQDVSSFDSEPVRKYYELQHTAAISAFLQKINLLDSFWRSVPEQPFPWEQSA